MTPHSDPAATPATLVDALRIRAAERPDKTLYRFLGAGDEEQTLTFAQLDRDARIIGAHLRARAGQAPTVALLLYPPGLEFIRAFFGCLYAGVIAVPLHLPGSRQENWQRLGRIAKDAGARFVLTDDGNRDAVHRWLQSAPELELTPLVSNSLRGEDAAAPAVALAPGGPETLAFLQYTSGSTGDPKGVMVSQANLMHNQRLMQRKFGHDDNAVVVGWLPQYHDMGLIGNILQPLYLGATAILMSPNAFLQNPLRWLQAISRYRATTSGGPNFAYRLCAERIRDEDKAGLDLRSWEVAFNGAEPISARTLDRFHQAFQGCGFRREAFFPCYGLAEGTLFAVGAVRQSGAVTRWIERETLARGLARPLSRDGAHGDGTDGDGIDSGAVELVSSGELPDEGALGIVDPASGVPCEPGTIGEIWLHSPSVANGYWQREALSREMFQARPAGDDRQYLRTGDLGFTHEGQLYVTGRLKDLVIVRGRNIYPQDVESTVQDEFPVLRSGCGACFGVEHDGEETLALVQEVERTALNRTDFRALWRDINRLLSERFGFRLHTLVLVRPAQVPKTSSGKVRRSACRDLLQQGQLAVVARFDADAAMPDAAADALHATHAGETELPDSPALRLLATVLRIPAHEFSPQCTLGSHGLDSLKAAEIEHFLDTQHGVRLDMSRLLDGMTVADFLAEVGDTRRNATAPDASADAPLETVATLGPQQHAIWQLQTLQPTGRAFNIALPLRVEERLDPQTLAEALSRLLQRHPQLNTAYHERDGVPTASLRADTAPALTVIEAAWDEARLDAALRQQAAEEIALDRSVMHAYLLQTGPQQSLLHLVVHHIAVDAWSMQVLVRDLAQAYRDISLGRPSPAPLARGYGDFLCAQQRWLESRDGAAAVAEARAAAGAHSGILNLPADRARPKRFAFLGDEVSLSLDEALSTAIRAKAGEWNTTLFTALLAAWQVLMHRLTGQTEFAIGIPVSLRPAPDFSDVVGCFVDLKPLSCDVAPDQPFREFVAHSRSGVLEMLRRKRVPSTLTRRDGAAPSGWPATVQPNVRFALLQATELADAAPFLLNLDGARAELAGLEFRSHSLATRSAQADLGLALLEHEGRLHARFNYNREIFARPRIERIAAMYAELWRSIIADDATPVRGLALLDRSERQRLLDRSAPAPARYGADACAHQLIERQTALRGDAIAVIGEEDDLSYAELNARANRIARWMRARGVQPEDRVGLYLRRTTDMVVAFLAALKAGACSVMLEPSLPPERRRLIIESSKIALLLTNVDDGFDLADTVLDLRDATAWNGYADGNLDLALTPDNAAYVIHTSGSTGRPKGVVGLHAGVVNRTRWMIEHFGLAPGERILHSTPMGFVRAEREILFPLCAGATVVILPQSGLNRADAVLDALERHRIGYTASSPSLLRMILDHDTARFAGLPSLRHWFIGADALRPDLIAAAQVARPTLKLTYFYGSTEVSSDVAYFDVPPGYATDAPTTPIGRALANTALYLLDASMEPVADGMPGEIHVGGLQLARGYLFEPELTADKFIFDPFSTTGGARLYRTGDIAYRREDGDLVMLGRNDDQVNLYGHRIELGEIEHALRALPSITDAVALPHRQGEHSLIVAYVVCPDAEYTGQLGKHLAVRLPDYMIPSVFIRLDALPVTALGKIDRAALRSIDLSLARAADHAPAETPLQARMAEILAELLGVPVELISVKRNFFELGANSVALSEFVARANRLPLPRPLRAADVFHYPTVRDLAAAMTADPSRQEGSTIARSAADRAQARRRAMDRTQPGRAG